MKLGIIGLPQCGKTTIFNVLTAGKKSIVHMAGGGKVQINTAVVSTPNERVIWLSQLYRPKKTTYASVTFQDITGIQGERGTFSSALLSTLSQIEGFLHVVRAFQEPSVPHSLECIDPFSDIRALQDELVLNDMLIVERKLQRLGEERLKGGGRKSAIVNQEQHLFKQLQLELESGNPLRDIQLGVEDFRLLSGFGLLTIKPVLIVLNTDESESCPQVKLPRDLSVQEAQDPLVLMPKLEMEIAQLDEQEAAFFMREYSLKESSLSLLIRSAYAMLSLRSFFTVSADEVREWSIKAGTNARQAAGIIHTDMETGFIRAEVIAFDDLQQMGSEAAVKSAGKWRLEGKDYPVQDGDIIKVRFSPPTRK